MVTNMAADTMANVGTGAPDPRGAFAADEERPVTTQLGHGTAPIGDVSTFETEGDDR